MSLHTYTSLLYLLGGPRDNNLPIAVSPSSTQTFASKYHSPLKSTMAPSRDGCFQNKAQMSLKHLTVSESKEILKE